MSDPGNFDEARAVASMLVGYLQEHHSELHPMQATAAAAIALGAMVATLNDLGITKAGQSGKLLSHLYKISEQTAITGLAKR